MRIKSDQNLSTSTELFEACSPESTAEDSERPDVVGGGREGKGGGSVVGAAGGRMA